MSKFIIKLDNDFIKHTSKFGPFYGSIIITSNKNEARLFSRKRDAIKLIQVLKWRIDTYDRDSTKLGHYKNITHDKIEI